MVHSPVIQYSLLTDQDIYLFRAGKHFKIYEKLGSQLTEVNSQKGAYFAVWAPNAQHVWVMGDFNNWKRGHHELYLRKDHSGIWEGFVPGIEKGAVYKYAIMGPNGRIFDKGDPYARYWEQPPNTASIVWDAAYEWKDDAWWKNKKQPSKTFIPLSVYEVHLGSWKKKQDEDGKLVNMTYRELADELLDYVKEMGFTHIELMPIMEFPYDPSWGYQITGFFAPTSRFGTPEDFKYFVDQFHQAGIGVILDWVPSHFPTDGHGPGYFDGTHLYEHADPRKGFHPDWTSNIFDYSRYEVRSFLISNALYWLRHYHIDGLRVDAVASMIYLDYSRDEGQWVPNKHGGNENLEAISFLQELNEQVHAEMPHVFTIAEESTAYPGVSHPVSAGGLGFDLKWMMGWMHDTLEYFKHDPYFRSHSQNLITFSFSYAHSEKYIMPLSHDEVVHLKASLIGRMPGDEWERFANLRCLYGFMFVHPGAQLLFMGGEFGQTSEWNFKTQLDWHLLQYDYHKGVQLLIKELNQLYKESPELYYYQYTPSGFEWIAGDDTQRSVIAFLRKGKGKMPPMVVVCHFTPVAREAYKVGVPIHGEWEEVLNTDAKRYGGKDRLNGNVTSKKDPWHGRKQSITIDLPPLSTMAFRLKTAIDE